MNSRRIGGLPANFKPPAKPKDKAEELKKSTRTSDEKIKSVSVERKLKSKVVLPTKIDLRAVGSMVRHAVPDHVFRIPPFKFDPKTFVLESDSLNTRMIEADLQLDSLERFLNEPRSKMIYAVTGNPDDSKAKYFAAYLASEHIKALGSKARVLWHTMYGNFENNLLKDSIENPTMLILCNLTVNSTNLKLEKTKDLIEKYSDIPRIVVAAGTDPISFLSTKLYCPVHGLMYLAESLIKQKVEVI